MEDRGQGAERHSENNEDNHPVSPLEAGVQGEAVQGSEENGVNSQPIDEQASLEDRVPSSEVMIEEQRQADDLQYKIRKYIEKTQLLHADEQFLKEELKVRERQTLDTYAVLMKKKKQLLQLVMQSFNRSEAAVDIGLTEELNELKKIISGQQVKIDNLRGQISKQGLAGVFPDDKQFKLKAKAEQMEKEIKVGRKFSSTQYVRDYLERPQAYKVSYEQSKYEYELRVRIKECLQMEKKVYEKKKEEINQLKRKEREREQELLKEKDLWSR